MMFGIERFSCEVCYFSFDARVSGPLKFGSTPPMLDSPRDTSVESLQDSSGTSSREREVSAG